MGVQFASDRPRHSATPATGRSAIGVAASAVLGAGAAALAGPLAGLTESPAETTGALDAHALNQALDTQSLALAAHPASLPADMPAHAAPTTGHVDPAGLADPAALAGRPAAPDSSPTITSGDVHRSDAAHMAALSRSVRPHRAPSVGSFTGRSTEHSDPDAAKAVGAKSVGALGDPQDLLGSSTGLKALGRAMTRLGDPYVWGAEGPNSFDCSGLVQWAFKQVGVTLPRSSTAQSQVGKPVSRGALRPGDLVFFYSPVSHVGIYLGNNKVLHASEPGKPVKISPMNFPYHNARRVT
jgi:peptidoglycan DL-endopeptidase CwlO